MGIERNIIVLGNAVRMIGLTYLSRQFGVSYEECQTILDDLQVPTMRVGSENFVNLTSLERAIFQKLKVPNQDFGRDSRRNENANQRAIRRRCRAAGKKATAGRSSSDDQPS